MHRPWRMAFLPMAAAGRSILRASTTGARADAFELNPTGGVGLCLTKDVALLDTPEVRRNFRETYTGQPIAQSRPFVLLGDTSVPRATARAGAHRVGQQW